MGFGATARYADGTAVVEAAGRITSMEANALREPLHDLLDKGHRKFVLNLRGVDHLDSWGIGELAGCYTTIKRQGGELKVVCLTPRVLEVLQVVRLHTVFEDFSDEQNAIRSFISGGAS